MAVYNLFPETPQLGVVADSDALSLGTEFYVTSPAWVTELRYLKPTSGGSAALRTAALYSTTDGLTGTLVAGPVTLPVPADGAWVAGELPAPFALVPGTRYRVVVLHPNGGYVATPRYFLDGAGAGDRVYGPLVVPTAENVPYYRQGSYQYGEALQFPTQSFNGASYYSDVTITTVDPALPPPVLLEDIALAVGRPTGSPLVIGAPQANPLNVGAPRGYDLILSEVTL